MTEYTLLYRSLYLSLLLQIIPVINSTVLNVHRYGKQVIQGYFMFNSGIFCYISWTYFEGLFPALLRVKVHAFRSSFA